MTIVEKLNEIEEQTKALAYQAQLLEENKRNYEGLLECEVHDHEWALEAVGSSLRHVQTIEIHCRRCRCWTLYTVGLGGEIPISHPTDVLLRDLIPEEDE